MGGLMKVSKIVEFLKDENQVDHPEHVNDNFEITGISQHWNAKKGDIAWTSELKPGIFNGALLLIPKNT